MYLKSTTYTGNKLVIWGRKESASQVHYGINNESYARPRKRPDTHSFFLGPFHPLAALPWQYLLYMWASVCGFGFQRPFKGNRVDVEDRLYLISRFWSHCLLWQDWHLQGLLLLFFLLSFLVFNVKINWVTHFKWKEMQNLFFKASINLLVFPAKAVAESWWITGWSRWLNTSILRTKLGLSAKVFQFTQSFICLKVMDSESPSQACHPVMTKAQRRAVQRLSTTWQPWTYSISISPSLFFSPDSHSSHAQNIEKADKFSITVCPSNLPCLAGRKKKYPTFVN